jgi:hypothetical protein
VFKQGHIDTSGQSAATPRRRARARVSRPCAGCLGVRARTPPQPCAFPRRPHLEAPCFYPAPRVAPRRRAVRQRAAHRADRRSVPSPARTCADRDAAVPWRYLLRHHYVTGERLFKGRAPSRAPCRAARHCRSSGEPSLRFSPVLSNRPKLLPRILGGLSRRPWPGSASPSPEPQPAAAATADHRRTPSPEPHPHRPTPPIDSR